MTVEEIETAKEYLIELGDEFVHEEEKIYPEDMFFICDLIETYYESHQEKSIHQPYISDISWELAIQLKNLIKEDPEVTWLNAFFVIDSLYLSSRRRPDSSLYEDKNKPPERNISHPDTFKYNVESLDVELPASRSDEDFESVFEELIELLELYIDEEKIQTTSISNETDGVPPLFELSIFFSSFKKRYAHSFVDDILESSISFKLSTFLIHLEKEQNIPQEDIELACSKVRNWAGFRARREYEKMVLGEA